MTEAKPVYRSAIWETQSGWSWRVEVDVQNGWSWSGHADFYEMAVAIVSAKLAGARTRSEPTPDPKPQDSAFVRFARSMEAWQENVRQTGKTLTEAMAEVERIRSRTRD